MSAKDLCRVIERLHGCTAVHRGSVLVEEAFEEPMVWRGYVEVFDIAGHPEARRCYGWSWQTESGKTLYHTILEAPPVDSPVTAVRRAITAEHRRTHGLAARDESRRR